MADYALRVSHVKSATSQSPSNKALVETLVDQQFPQWWRGYKPAFYENNTYSVQEVSYYPRTRGSDFYSSCLALLNADNDIVAASSMDYPFKEPASENSDTTEMTRLVVDPEASTSTVSTLIVATSQEVLTQQINFYNEEIKAQTKYMKSKSANDEDHKRLQRLNISLGIYKKKLKTNQSVRWYNMLAENVTYAASKSMPYVTVLAFGGLIYWLQSFAYASKSLSAKELTDYQSRFILKPFDGVSGYTFCTTDFISTNQGLVTSLMESVADLLKPLLSWTSGSVDVVLGITQWGFWMMTALNLARRLYEMHQKFTLEEFEHESTWKKVFYNRQGDLDFGNLEAIMIGALVLLRVSSNLAVFNEYFKANGVDKAINEAITALPSFPGNVVCESPTRSVLAYLQSADDKIKSILGPRYERTVIGFGTSRLGIGSFLALILLVFRLGAHVTRAKSLSHETIIRLSKKADVVSTAETYVLESAGSFASDVIYSSELPFLKRYIRLKRTMNLTQDEVERLNQVTFTYLKEVSPAVNASCLGDELDNLTISHLETPYFLQYVCMLNAGQVTYGAEKLSKLNEIVRNLPSVRHPDDEFVVIDKSIIREYLPGILQPEYHTSSNDSPATPSYS